MSDNVASVLVVAIIASSSVAAWLGPDLISLLRDRLRRRE